MTPPDELSWLAAVSDLDGLQQAWIALGESGRVSLAGPPAPARALNPLLVTEPPLLIVGPRERDVEETTDDLRTLAAEGGLEGAILSLPAPGPPPFRGLPRHVDASARRAAALLAARRPGLRALVASPSGLLRPSLTPRLLETRVVHLEVGEEMTPEMLIEALDEGGYVREDPVTAPGPVSYTHLRAHETS